MIYWQLLSLYRCDKIAVIFAIKFILLFELSDRFDDDDDDDCAVATQMHV